METAARNRTRKMVAAQTACFVIDFDGTVTSADIIDAVLQEFAPAAWRNVEALWEQGIIGSRECLERQMAMVDAPLARLLDFIDGFSIDDTFGDFVRFLQNRKIPFAIVSDGFQVFIERLLHNAGLNRIPVLANGLMEQKGKLGTLFPYTDPGCSAANCKCTAVSELSRDRFLVAIGDGQSDFCLADQADHVFTKKKLTDYCRLNGIIHTPFERFNDLTEFFRQERAHAPGTSASLRKDRSCRNFRPNR